MWSIIASSEPQIIFIRIDNQCFSLQQKMLHSRKQDQMTKRERKKHNVEIDHMIQTLDLIRHQL